MELNQENINLCNSISDVCRMLGISASGGNHARIKLKIKELGLDISHFKNGHWNKGRKVKGINIKKPLEEFLIENSTHKNTCSLKNRLIKEGYKLNRCEICGYEENLELHHINGNPTDNRLENLQILCPNCHAKTDNFRGRNKIGRNHIPASELFLSSQEIKQREEERKLARTKNKVEQKSRKAQKICPICGKHFFPKSKASKFCSQKCYKEFQSNLSNRPNIFDFLKAFKEKRNFCKVAEFFNVTDNAVRKWCEYFKIPKKPKELLSLIDKYIK